MAAMLRSCKILRLFPQITRINARSGYQNVQTYTAKFRQSFDLLNVARALSTNFVSVNNYNQPVESHNVSPGQPQHRRPMRGQLQTDLQTVLRELDNQVQRTGRMTESRFLNVFDKVCESGSVTPNQALLLIRSCGNLLVELTFDKRNALVMNIWDKMSELGVRYDVTHYNALLWVFLENEYKFNPTEFLAQMESKGVEPNRVTYQRMISIYCRQGDIQGATLILEVLKSKDLPVTEGVFNSLITGNARAGDMENARNMLSVMRNMGLDPSLDTYAALACAYAEKGDIENINKVIEEVMSSDLVLTTSFYFKVVNSLTRSGHKEHVNQFLNKVELARFIPDAINLSLNLWTECHEEVSFAILKTFTTLRSDNLEQTNRCSFYIDHMMQSSRKITTEALISYLDQIESLGLHSKPHSHALFFALRDAELAKDVSISLLKRMKERGQPVRPHYFWPLIVKEADRGNTKGVLEVLRNMVDIEVSIDVATYSDYIIPALSGDVDAILKQVQEAGIQPDAMLLVALCRSQLRSNKRNAIANIVKLYETYPELRSSRYLERSISNIFVIEPKSNLQQLVKLLKIIGIQSKSSGPEEMTETMEMSETTSDGNRVDSPRVRLGEMLYSIVSKIRLDEAARMRPVLENLFRILAAEEMTISFGQLRGIRNQLNTRLRMKNMNNVLYSLADKDEVLADPILNADLLTAEQVEANLNLLESHLKDNLEDTSRKSILIKLIEVYMSNNNSEKVGELLKEYEDAGYGKSGTIYRDMILMHCREGHLEQALEVKRELEQQYDSLTDIQVYKELITLQIKNGRTDDAYQMLQDLNCVHPRAMYVISDVVLKVLENIADLGLQHETMQLMAHCVDQGIVKPSRRLLKPLVAVHLKKNDLPGAVEAIKEIHDRYQIQPPDHDLLVKLIESGNTKLLQEAMKYSGDLSGEVSMIFSLAFAFMENGKYEEAEKLFKAPGIDARTNRLEWFANRCLDLDMAEQMERLVDFTKNIYGCDVDTMYFYKMRLHVEKQNNVDKCMEVYYKMQEEDIIPSARTLHYLANVLQDHNRTVPFDIPEENGQELGPGRERWMLEEKAKEPGEEVFKSLLKDKKPWDESVGGVDEEWNHLKSSWADAAEKICRRAKLGTKKEIHVDPNLSPLDQVKVLVRDHKYNRQFNKEAVKQIERSIRQDGVENFLAIKEELQKVPGFTSSLVFRNQEMRACVANSDLEGAHRVFDDTIKAYKKPTRDMVVLLASKYASAGQTEKILAMRRDYEGAYPHHFPANRVLLGSYVTRNDVSGAIQYINERLNADTPVSKLGLRSFFTAVMESNQSLDSVIEFVEGQMKVGEFLPMRSLVFAYMFTDQVEVAKSLIQKHEELKGCLLPYAIQMTQSNTVLTDKLQQVLDLSDVDGTDRSIVYSYLLKGHATNNDWEGALRVRDNMAAENLTMDDIDLKRLALLLRENRQEVPYNEPPESLKFYIDKKRQARAEQTPKQSDDEVEWSMAT